MSKIQEIAQVVENGKVKLIEGLVQEALDAGEDPNAILNEGMINAMGIVGAKFQANEIFVPEMLVAAKTMKKGVEILRPHLAGDSVGKHGKYIIGTVAGDLHDIGKNLVALMIESAGFEVVDLGVDVEASVFVDAVREHKPKVLCMSALLTTTMPAMVEAMDLLRSGGLRDSVKVMVGGAPVNEAFCKEIGADGYADDAATGAEWAKNAATA